LKLKDLLKDAVSRLESAGIPNPSVDAEVLLSYFGKIENYKIKTEPEMEIESSVVKAMEEAIARREQFEPVAYITGTKEFYSLDFKVNKDVLIPRPETELLVDMGIYWAKYSGSLLDLCTGSGAAAIAIKKNRQDLYVAASDISNDALKVAKENSENILGRGRIDFSQGDLFEPFEGETFDVIVSNPPYVNPEEKENLQRDLEFEPRNALYCDDNGRAVIERIISGASDYLNDGGVLLLEIGHDQKDFVISKGNDFGFESSVLNDYAGLPRIATLRK